MVMSGIQSGRVTAIILLASFLMSCGGKAGGEKETSGADSRAQESTETAAVINLVLVIRYVEVEVQAEVLLVYNYCIECQPYCQTRCRSLRPA